MPWEVDEWNPRSDTVPVHRWLLPWVEVCGEAKLRPFYPTLRHKLGTCLEAWTPSDSTAKVHFDEFYHAISTFFVRKCEEILTFHCVITT